MRLQPTYGSGLELDDEDLQAAARVYGQWKEAAEERVRQALRLIPDPLLHCFICQLTLWDCLNDGGAGGCRAGYRLAVGIVPE